MVKCCANMYAVNTKGTNMRLTVDLKDEEILMLNEAFEISHFRNKTDYIRALIFADHGKKQRAGIIAKVQKNDD